MANANKSTVRLEKDTLQILKAIQKSTPWPISLAALVNGLVRNRGRDFEPESEKLKAFRAGQWP